MTNNAIRNKEILANIMMNKARLDHDKAEKAKDRKSAEFRDISSAQIGAVGRVGSSALKFANSPEWYKKWPDIGSIIGKGTVPTFVQNNVLYDTVYMPAAVTFFYGDTFGDIETMLGTTITPSMLPINEAALRYQTNLYSYNSVLASVAASDVMEYTLAACDLVSFYALIARALKAYKTFDVNTPTANEVFVKAAGWDVSDMKANYKDIVAWLCTEITSFNNDIALPADLSLLNRKWFLASGCWGEDYGKNSAVYFTRPLFYHVWNEVAGRLEANRYPQYLTYAAAITIHQQMKSKLVGSSNIVELVRNIKSGVSKGLELVHIPDFEEGSLPIYPVDEVLEQLMNATMPSKVSWTGSLNLATSMPASTFFSSSGPSLYHLLQDTSGYLIPSNSLTISSAERYRPYGHVSSNMGSADYHIEFPMLNFLHDDVSVDDLIVSTRFHNDYYIHMEPTQIYIEAKTCGTEVLLGMIIDEGLTPGTEPVRFSLSYSIADYIRLTYPLRAVPTAVEWASTTGAITRYVQDWHSMVTLDHKTLYQINKGATLSEFYIGSSTGERISFSGNKGPEGAKGNNHTYKGKRGKNHGKPKAEDKDKDTAK